MWSIGLSVSRSPNFAEMVCYDALTLDCEGVKCLDKVAVR